MVAPSRPVTEMIGATNWWLDKNGRAHMVFQSHAEFAQQKTGIKFIHFGVNSQRGWKMQGKAYETMYRNGWVRVSYKSEERRMQIEFRGAISRPAMEWLQDQAFDRQSVVVDDTGRIYADFRPEDEQGGTTYRYRNNVSERVVEMLLGEPSEPDPKATAQRTKAYDYERTIVYIDTCGDQVPVGFGENGFFYHDAAYSLGQEVSEEEYGAVMGQILQDLNAGIESGVAHGHKWELRPHSSFESPEPPTGPEFVP
jgi:hypothetical protein